MDYMARALALARKVLGTTSPNPAVGAVIVREGEIVGEGYTQPPGGDHAEIVALKQAGERARGATLYTTLEPCCHYGRTPPCTRAIIRAGISQVHLATLDPNPLVAGKGRQELEAAGIKTFLREGEEEAREINEAYFKFITTGLPFVVAKFAMSLDGKSATHSGDSRWLSGQEARRFVHQLRRQADAIMVGVNTVLRDDPQLTARDDNDQVVKVPIRVVVDSRCRTPLSAKLVQEPGKTLLAIAHTHRPRKLRKLAERGVEVVELEGKKEVDLAALFQALGKRQVTSLLVEGGGTLLGSLFDLGLVDKVYAFVCPLIIGGWKAKTPVAGEGVVMVAQAWHLDKAGVERLGQDVLIWGYPKRENERA